MQEPSRMCVWDPGLGSGNPGSRRLNKGFEEGFALAEYLISKLIVSTDKLSRDQEPVMKMKEIV